LVDEVFRAFEGLGPLQVVLVNDGSTDRTHEVCEGIVDARPDTTTYARLGRNFGEHNAVMCGLTHALGDYVVIMDDDFQNRPEDAVCLYRVARDQDRDLVYTRPTTRQHSWFRRLGSAFNGRVAGVLLDAPRGLYLSSFKCISRPVVNGILEYEGPYPYIDGLALRCTRNIAVVDVQQQAREAGSSGYSLRKLAGLWLNMFVNFSVKPLRVGTVLGAVLVVLAVLLSFWVAAEMVSGRELPAGWPLLFIALMMFSGAQLLILGMVGEYVGRILLAQNRTPQFFVSERRGVGAESSQGPASRTRPGR